jgi:hypothetical protein
VHLFGILLKPLEALHLLDIPLVQKVNSVRRFVGSEIQKTKPPTRPAFAKEHKFSQTKKNVSDKSLP